MGYHRDTFYEVQKAFKIGGVAALVEQRRAPRSPHPNRVPEAFENRILKFCLGKPTYGTQRVANELRLEGVDVSPSGVRGVWLRHDLETRYKRLMRLEAAATAADLVYDRVLPFYEALGVQVKTILTDNGREFCGRPEGHPYELLRALHDIEHRTTRIRSPRTNGFVERMNRILLDEHFRIKGREKWHESPEQIQQDLDELMEFYNLKRSHQGYRLKGRTPAQALRNTPGRKRLPPIVLKETASEIAEAA